MAHYTYAGSFPSSPSEDDTLSMNGATYIYTSLGTWRVQGSAALSIEDGGLTKNNFTDADHSKLDSIESSATADQTGAEIKAAYEGESDTNAFTDAKDTKLSGIATSANNYSHPAAHSISEVTGLQAAIDGKTTESYVDTAVANVVNSAPEALDTLNELADALGDDANFAATTATSLGEKLPKAGGAMTGAITTNSTFDGRDVATDGTKLDTIETNATADQSKSDIEALGIAASSITGALPAIDGSSLTGIEGVPSGIISMWSGSAAAIPTGWSLCDGTNSTPNLVGKFIKAASTAGGTGGSSSHTHSDSFSVAGHTLTLSEIPSHTHYSARGDSAGGSSGKGHQNADQSSHEKDKITSASGGGGSHSHGISGSVSSASHEPEYFELCYIMKD